MLPSESAARRLTKDQLYADPYPIFSELQAEDVFHRVDGMLFNMPWSHVVTGHAEVSALLRDPRISADYAHANSWFNVKKARWVPKILRCMMNTMVATDAPDHMRLRKLATQAFTPQTIKSLSSRIVAITDERLDAMANKDTVDLMEDFALPIPLTVISEMLGVPKQKREQFHDYSTKIVDKPPSNIRSTLSLVPSLLRIQGIFEELIEEKRRRPGDDLTSALIAAEEDGDSLDNGELVGMLFLLLLAGHETTTNLLGSGILALLQHPAEFEKYTSDNSLIDSMIEEMLRYTNPVQHALPRIAKEKIDIEGKTIHKGESVLLFVAAANRDKAVFENPETFDIGRTPNKHLAFGYGVHHCLGAQLARLETKIALERLLARYPAMELAVPASQITWRKSIFLRGLASLPIRLND